MNDIWMILVIILLCGMSLSIGWMLCKLVNYGGDILVDDTVENKRHYRMVINEEFINLEKKKFIVIKIVKGANLRETNIAHDEHKNI